MDEWTVVLVLIALVDLIAAIVKPVISLTQSITKLTVVVDGLSANHENLTQKNADSHERIWQKNEEQDTRLESHETRITIIEKTSD